MKKLSRLSRCDINQLRILIGNYDPETGTELLHAFEEEKSLQVRALMIIALFPAWIPLVDRAWQSREA